MAVESRKCEHCKKSLVAIGHMRRNGKSGSFDTDMRKYHRLCYKKLIEDMEFREKMDKIQRQLECVI